MKKLVIGLLGLWLLTIGTLAALFIHGKTSAGSDGRQAVVLAASERDFVLGEMRGMLEAVRDMTDALSRNDRAGVAAAGRKAGQEAVGGVPSALMLKLPLDFKLAGMAMHGGFDEIAAAVDAGESKDALEGRMASLLGRCAACHQTWRFDVTP